jgi:hypothetical protein
MIKKISILALLLFCGIAYAADGYVSRAFFSTNIENREPTNRATKVSTDTELVNLFTEVKDCVGCTLQHRWYRDGKRIHDLETKVTAKRYRWWTGSSVKTPGEWEGEVLLNGKVQQTVTLSVFDAAGQPKAPTVQQRLKSEKVDECEKNLKYFHDMVRRYPDDPYYEFMFQKWGKRCY